MKNNHKHWLKTVSTVFIVLFLLAFSSYTKTLKEVTTDPIVLHHAPVPGPVIQKKALKKIIKKKPKPNKKKKEVKRPKPALKKTETVVEKPPEIEEIVEEDLPTPNEKPTPITIGAKRAHQVKLLYSANFDEYYPDDAWKKDKEGTIEMKALINVQGKVESTEVVFGDDTFGFVTAANAWLKTCKFEPIREYGVPTPFYVIIPIHFTLY